MKSFADILWFLWCGARERVVKAGAYGAAGTCLAVYGDVMGPFKDTVWVLGLILTGLTLLFLLTVLLVGRKYQPLTTIEGTNPPRRATKTKPVLPKQLHVYRDIAIFGLLSAAQLFGTGIGQMLVGSRASRSDTGSISLFATLIPELQGLRHEVAGVRENLERVDQKLGKVKLETSDDPRKELANMGIGWTVDAFFDAIRRGDRRAVELFLAGDMTTVTPDSQGRPLPVILALNAENVAEILDMLVAAGLDVNHAYEISAPMGKQRMTLLSRAIEKGNLPLVEALIRHKVRTDDSIQTFGAMGFMRDTYPLASALYWQQIAIAEAILDAGANPGTGDYAAYREAQALRTKRLQPETAARLDALIVRLAPTGKAQDRIEAERRLRAVEQQLNQVALQSIGAMRGSSERARLDQQYQALQQEAARLRAQLGIASR